MKKILLVVFCSLLAVGGLGVSIKRGPAGASLGALNPSSGTDTVFAMGENIDHAGLNTVELVIDDDTNVVHDVVRWIGRTGQTGERWLSAFVDDSAKGEYRELVKWHAGENTNSNANAHVLSGTQGSDSLLNGGHAIVPLAGGTLRAELISVRAGYTNSGNANRCNIRVMKDIDETAATNCSGIPCIEPDTNAATSTLTYCTGAIQIGAGSSNSGGFGDTTVGALGTLYVLPLSDCVCDDGDCVMYVTVESRDLTGDGDFTNDECTAVNDLYIGLKVSEDYP